MSKTQHYFHRKQKISMLITLGICGLITLTTYAVTSQEINTFIQRVAGSYMNVEGVKQYYDRIASQQTDLDAEGRKVYFSTISQVHRAVADIHNRIADYADQRFVESGGEPRVNTGSTNTGNTTPGGNSTGTTNTGTNNGQIDNTYLQVQFYGVPYTANGKGTLTRGRDYDGYYGLSNKIPESGPFICKAWYSTNKAKTLGREIQFTTENGISNTSTAKTDDLMMRIDFASDVTETLLKVTCSGQMGGTWRTLEYNETFSVVAPAKAVIQSFTVSNNAPNPGESLTFSWQTTGAVGCELRQLVDGGVRFSLTGQPANGSINRIADTSGTSIYRLICPNGIGEDSMAFDIEVSVGGTTGGTTNPTCGSSNGKDFASAPNAGLCSLGNPNPSPAIVDPANANKWKWSCYLGSKQVACSANKTTTTQTGSTTPPQCGSSNNGNFSVAPTISLCNPGTPQPATPTLDSAINKWKWDCTNGGQTVACTANKVIGNTGATMPQCGTSNNGSFATAPTTNLCLNSTSQSLPTLNTSTNKWSWNCFNGVQNVQCTANKTTTTQTGSTGPQCGAVNNGIYINAPTTYLCEIGVAQPTTPTLDATTNRWKWGCTASGQTVNCSAAKGDPGTTYGQYAFSPQCADADAFISLGGISAMNGNQVVNANYTPSTICKIPSSIPSNLFSFHTELVNPIDTIGADGQFNWGCRGISSNGSVDPGSETTCSARKQIDAECGPYNGVARTSFDELTPGIRGGPVPDTLNRSYCTVGTAMHENGSVALDNSEFGYFHWECRTTEFYKSCKAPYEPSRTINFTASKSTATANESISFSWSLPINTAFVKCYPVYDYTGQANAVYDFYNGSKTRQGSFASSFTKTSTVSLYCIGKTNDVYATKDIVITVGGGTAAVTCPEGSTNGVKSPDSLNTCNFAWGKTDAGKPASGVVTSGGGVLTGTCGANGAWSTWTLSCPNKTNVVSCSGGGITVGSLDGSNTCVADYAQRNAGQSVTIGNGLTITSKGPAATGSATCNTSGVWSYNINCPSLNTTVKTCPGGSDQIKSTNGTKICDASWGITNASTWASATVTNGGSLRAYCDANGNWLDTSISASCPN